jgi:hypothetical protein
LSWLNLRHVTEEKLDETIAKVVNAYNTFELPKHWGSSSSASADGTKWDIYEQKMPRIRGIKQLKFYRSHKGILYEHFV